MVVMDEMTVATTQTTAKTQTSDSIGRSLAPEEDTSSSSNMDLLEAQEVVEVDITLVAPLLHSSKEANNSQQVELRSSPNLPISDIASLQRKDQAGESTEDTKLAEIIHAIPVMPDNPAIQMQSAPWQDVEAQGALDQSDTQTLTSKHHTSSLLNDMPDVLNHSELKPMINIPTPLKDLPYDPGNGINLEEDEPMAPDTFASANFAIPTSQIESSSGEATFFESAASINDADVRVKAYAKLEFPDGQFFMNTYSLMLGRDIRAAKAHEIAHANSETHLHKRRRRAGREGPRNIASSVVSESGGIVGVGVQDPATHGHVDAAVSKSGSSEPLGPSRNDSTYSSILNTDYQKMGMASLGLVANGNNSVDARSLLPSPDECPLIPIHPPVVESGASAGYKGISRVHARVSYNFARSLFELEVLGRNGLFIDETHFAQSEISELKNGSIIQIGGVRIKFVLPDVAIGETGAEGTTMSGVISGSAMSFDFEDGRGANVAMADSTSPTTGEGDSNSDQYESEHLALARMSALAAELENQESESESEEVDEEQEEEEEEVEKRVSSRRHHRSYQKSSQGWKSKARAKGPPTTSKTIPRLKLNVKPREATGMKEPGNTEGTPRAVPPPRKGPGRPPKNGYMSKRQEQELKRQAKTEAAAKELPHQATKVGSSGPPTPFPEKRKYKKRISKVDPQPDVVQSTEISPPPDLAKQLPKPPKEKRPPKPPRSPSPVWDLSTLTEEQLQKPPLSYVVLIHEALTNSPAGQMSLPQIYRAIERKYPWYKLRVTTQGWQSSVRHNLSQHGAFQKIERDGKGWMWGLVADFPIEKDKKQRRPSPPMVSRPTQRNPYPPNGHPPSYPSAGMPPNGFMPPPPGQPPYPPYPGPHFPGAHGYPPPGLSRAPIGFAIPLAIPRPDSSSTYQSPYGNSAPSNLAPVLQSPTAGENLSSANAPLTRSTPDADRPGHSGISENPINSTTIPSDQEHVIQRFKGALVASMPKYPNADQMVTQAIDRVLEIPPKPSDQPPIIYPEEETVMHAFRNLMANLKEKGRHKSQAQSPNPGMAHTSASQLSQNNSLPNAVNDTTHRSANETELEVTMKQEVSLALSMPSESQEQIVQILAQLGEQASEAETAIQSLTTKDAVENEDPSGHLAQQVDPQPHPGPIERSPTEQVCSQKESKDSKNSKDSKDSTAIFKPRVGRSRGKRALAEMVDAGDDEMLGMPITRSKRLAI